MHVWRLTRPEYAPGLDGLGARKEGGRWNSPGRAVVYCGGSLALSCLEVFVHLPPSMRVSHKLPNLIAVKLEVPTDLAMEVVHLADVPLDAGISEYRAFGDRWLKSAQSAILCVPSMVIPHEVNYLLNPQHPEMSRVKVVSQEPFTFDPRLGVKR
jgi:RES domain-containing protein